MDLDGWSDQARDLVPDHTKVGRAQEYSDFTYGRVKRTFQENDPETMARIRSAMESLGLDIDEAIARVKAGQVRTCSLLLAPCCFSKVNLASNLLLAPCSRVPTMTTRACGHPSDWSARGLGETVAGPALVNVWGRSLG
jgi:hypothetical protein